MEQHIVALARQVVAQGRASDAYLVESLAYGNLKLEDQSLQRSTVAEAVRRAAVVCK